MGRLYISLLFLLITIDISAQNEFYINGEIVYVNERISNNIATLRVNGSIINNNGSFTNDSGLIELTGDWTNTSSANYYQSTGIERFTDTFNQVIYGDWNGTILNQNQFYDFKIHKVQARGQYVSLNASAYINPLGSVEFESTNGIIRTDIISHGSNGSLYPNELYMRNPAPAKLIGNNWTTVAQFSNTGGATTKYIEGKLRRQVSSLNTYNFPIGVAPTSLDGMEGISVSYTGPFTATNVVAFLQPASLPSYTLDLITNGSALFYDVGALPSVSPLNQFQNCVGGPDGHDDIAVIDAAVTHEWIVLSATATSNYNLSAHPGPVLDNISYVPMGTPCNAVYPKTKYIARNGRIGGDEAIGPTTNYWNPNITGLYQKPNGNKLTAQTQIGFSRYRLFGTTNPANTSLPVEMVNLLADAVDNEYIKVSWTTASEYNNKGFTLLKSTDANSFDSIAWIAGNGSSNNVHNYSFDDRNVAKGITYYYKLKQVDFNNDYHYTNIVSGKLISDNEGFDISVFPNPSNSNTDIQIISRKNEEMSISVFDIIGQQMYSKEVKINANTLTKVDIPSAGWANGVYIINTKFLNENDMKTIKFIKD